MSKSFPLFRFTTQFQGLESLSLWKHKNGDVYSILVFTDIEFPQTANILYMRIKDTSIWLRPYLRWHTSFTLLPNSSLQETVLYMENSAEGIKLGSTWSDYNKTQNIVVGFANLLTENPTEYPITVLYHQRFANVLRSCDEGTWKASMLKLK